MSRIAPTLLGIFSSVIILSCSLGSGDIVPTNYVYVSCFTNISIGTNTNQFLINDSNFFITNIGTNLSIGFVSNAYTNNDYLFARTNYTNGMLVTMAYTNWHPYWRIVNIDNGYYYNGGVSFSIYNHMPVTAVYNGVYTAWINILSNQNIIYSEYVDASHPLSMDLLSDNTNIYLIYKSSFSETNYILSYLADWNNVDIYMTNNFWYYEGTIFQGMPFILFSENSSQFLQFKYLSNGSWFTVSNSNRSYVYQSGFDVDDSGVYISFINISNSNRLCVERFSNGAWEAVGPNFISDGESAVSRLDVWNGVPTIAFVDLANGANLTVMTYSNSTWNVLGAKGIFPDPHFYYEGLALQVYNGIPFLAYYNKAAKNIVLACYSNSAWQILNQSTEILNTDYPYTSVDLQIDDGIVYYMYNTHDNCVLRYYK